MHACDHKQHSVSVLQTGSHFLDKLYGFSDSKDLTVEQKTGDVQTQLLTLLSSRRVS